MKYCHGNRDANARVKVRLENNGYEGIVIAVHRDVKETPTLLDKIKSIFTNASSILHTATDNRAYFRHITILVPSSWNNRPEYEVATFESFETANIIITNKGFSASRPSVKHFQECGRPGLYMHLPLAFLTNPNTPCKQGPLDKVIVHEWGHLRWGLFDEYATSDTEDDTIYNDEQGFRSL
ncbi:calcium-activated chloride channel regulator family member 3-like [Glandiceps talaboti]